MTSQDPSIDARAVGAAGSAEQPTQEEVRAYLEQLRGAPVDQVVAEVASALLNAAQVKLGRRDGRLLLDIVGDLTERIRGQLPDELTRQLNDVLSQLRLAQVEAEREVAQAAAQGHPEPADLGRTAAEDEPSAGSPSPPGSEPSQEQAPSAASRLWVPGR